PSSTRFTNVFLSSWYHDGPTVYCNRLSGDVARRVAEKKHDGIGNILGLADAAERELRAARAEFFQCGIRERLGGFRHPGDNRIVDEAEHRPIDLAGGLGRGVHLAVVRDVDFSISRFAAVRGALGSRCRTTFLIDVPKRQARGMQGKCKSNGAADTLSRTRNHD